MTSITKNRTAFSVVFALAIAVAPLLSGQESTTEAEHSILVQTPSSKSTTPIVDPQFDDEPLTPENAPWLEPAGGTGATLEAVPELVGPSQRVDSTQPSIAIGTPTESQNGLSKPIDAGDKIDQLLTRIVLKNMPHEFTEDKDWNKQDERWDGLSVRREGFQIRTKRKKKLVNHGTWKKYSAQLVNPEQEFSISVKNMRQNPEGKMEFDVHFGANLDIQGRQAKWVKGVQLYSLGVEGHATVRLTVAMQLDVSMDVTKFPPDLTFKPFAKDADIVVDEFRIDRVGKAGGEVAQQVTRSARKVLDRKIEDKKQKLVKKLNKELLEQEDKLRISVVDAVKSKWAEPSRAFLPDSVREALPIPQSNAAPKSK